MKKTEAKEDVTRRNIRARQAKIEFAREGLICLDGEIVRGSAFTVECLPGALNFLVPAGAAHTGKGVDMAREKAL